MQLTEVFCYALLTITISTVCAQGERYQELGERKNEKRLRRREATIFVEGYPTEKYEKPKVIVRRLSKHRYGPQKSKYGPPKPYYNYAKSTKRPGKKYYKSRLNTKYGYTHYKKPVTSHPRYRPNRKVKPHHGPTNKRNPIFPAYNHHKPAGFGEPPNFVDDYKPTRPIAEADDYRNPTIDPPSNQGYGEPPVDSYGIPIQSNLHDLIVPSSHNAQNLAANDKHTDTYPLNLKPWRNHQQENDNRNSFSKKKPVYVKINSDANIYVTPIPKDENVELHLNSYSDIYDYKQNQENNSKKKQYFRNNIKIVNKPWKGKLNNMQNEVIVGGQYAEPPARYATIPQNAIPSNYDDYEFVSPENHDPDIVSSATNSPYVNYKHSNVAFSPQNLNDAFSIVD